MGLWHGFCEDRRTERRGEPFPVGDEARWSGCSAAAGTTSSPRPRGRSRADRTGTGFRPPSRRCGPGSGDRVRLVGMLTAGTHGTVPPPVRGRVRAVQPVTQGHARPGPGAAWEPVPRERRLRSVAGRRERCVGRRTGPCPGGRPRRYVDAVRAVRPVTQGYARPGPGEAGEPVPRGRPAAGRGVPPGAVRRAADGSVSGRSAPAVRRRGPGRPAGDPGPRPPRARRGLGTGAPGRGGPHGAVRPAGGRAGPGRSAPAVCRRGCPGRPGGPRHRCLALPRRSRGLLSDAPPGVGTTGGDGPVLVAVPETPGTAETRAGRAETPRPWSPLRAGGRAGPGRTPPAGRRRGRPGGPWHRCLALPRRSRGLLSDAPPGVGTAGGDGPVLVALPETPGTADTRAGRADTPRPRTP
ncbi:DUF6578 domain-containing protein [Streptomyces sp. NPDC090106]|uniref:DUF6578 domain-containing protein n=1 Tax=Streptomyces sp. NPDC090106 TaxID=3365946 RepID=UPI0038247F0E